MTDTQNPVVRNQAATDEKFELLTRFLNKCTRGEWFVLLSCTITIVVAVGAVYNSNTTSTTAKVSDAIKSLEATLEKRLDQTEQDARAHIRDAIKYLEATLDKKFEQSEQDSQAHLTDAIKSLEAHIEAVLERKLDQLRNPSFNSCKEVYESQRLQEDKAYLLEMDRGTVPVYCHMTENLGECGGGGWTLVMKIDGNKPTFHYDSIFWSNKMSFNLPGGKTGFDAKETKLPSYWNTPFTKICLGMKIGEQFKFILIKWDAESLYSLIADGQYRATSLGVDTWNTLTGSQASFDDYREGFNSVNNIVPLRIVEPVGVAMTAFASAWSVVMRNLKARIGIVGYTNTVVRLTGFGIGKETSGTGFFNYYRNHNENPENIKAFGYILVQ